TIVPVSTMNPAEGRIRPRRASAYERLGARQRRVLELHEAVYSVGIRFYRHTHAVSARALVHLLLALDPPASEVQAAVREFVHAEPKPGPAGSFVLSGNPRGQEACPKYVDITPVGGRGWHVVIGAYSWEQYANRYEGVPASSQNASLRIREF